MKRWRGSAAMTRSPWRCMAAPLVFLPALLFLQSGGCVFEFLVFDQAPDELPAGIIRFIFLLHLRLLIDGQELTALDVHEGGCHRQEVPGHVEIQHAHHLDILNELGGNLGQIHLVNVHLLLLYQVKKEIEWAFKDLKLDLIFEHACAR